MTTNLNLSEAQRAVVDHRGADIQVVACAGSGKTESIAQRVAALINEGADPSSIVAFTFTERAATELHQRIVRRVADVKGDDFRDRLASMFVGTIHSYSFRLLQTYVPRFGNYDVLDEHRHAGFLSREFFRIGLQKLRTRHWQPVRDFARTVDVIANENIPANSLVGTPIGECYAAYRQTLHRHHFLTFGLIIAEALTALEDPEILSSVRGPLSHLVVDEYQDINPSQERLIGLLSTPPVKLVVVGDDDQSIYQWRGADVRNIISFRSRRANVIDITLSENRRSRPGIVRSANAFAQTIPGRIPKEMRATREAGPNQVNSWSAKTEEEEAKRLVDTIVELKALGYQYRDIAILYRSVRTSAPPLIEELRARGIPYSAAGRTGLFMQPEVAFLAEIYAWFVDGDWRDEPYGEFRPANLDRIILGLNRFFGEEPILDLKAYLEDWRAFMLRGSRPVNLIGDYYKLLRFLGVHQIDLSTPVGSAQMGALARLSEVLADFEHVYRRGRQVEKDGELVFESGEDRGRRYFQSLHNYLLHYARDAYEDFEGEMSIDLDAVDILTIHQAKGLEWSIVFMPSLVSTRFPSRWAGQAQSWLLPDNVFPPNTRSRYEGSDAEERRLFYVALTRAREAVYLSYFQRKKNQFRPSEYLLEVSGDVMPPVGGPIPLPVGPAPTVLKDPPTLNVSYSDLAAFEECGFRYRLSSVIGFQTQIVPELGYGRAIHHTLRQLAERVRATGQLPDRAELTELTEDEFYVPFASRQAWQTMKKAARRLVVSYVDKYAGDLTRVWAVERLFSLHVEDGVISGRADVILDEENGQIGKLAIVDYKVTADEARVKRYEEQLKVYSLAGRGEGLTVEAAYLHELKEGSRSPINISEAATQTTFAAVSRRLRKLRDSEFIAKPDVDRCQACEYRLICTHATGETADQ